jgi:CHAD domain-containing protein
MGRDSIAEVPSTPLKRSLEHELKLRPSAGFSLEQLAGDPVKSRFFSSVYHDSADRALARLGITLRRRTENGRSVWQLTLPRPSGRLEIEASGPPSAPPAEIADLLRAPLLDRALERVAQLRTRRSAVRVHGSADAIVEVMLDSVEVMDGRRVSARFGEIEVDLLSGSSDALRKVGKRVVRAGAESDGASPTIFRALGMEVDDATGAELPEGAPFALQLGRMLRRQVDEIRSHDPGVKLGDDPEDVHDLRVAVRRLRALLRSAASTLPAEWTTPLRSELKWLGTEVLGPLRDLDVLLAHLREATAALGADADAADAALAPLAAEHTAARELVLATLVGDRYLELLIQLDRSVDNPPVVADAAPAAIAAAEFRKLRRRMSAVDADATDEELHSLRIRGKKARYAAELAEPAVGRPAKRFVASAKQLQDVLGEHQDALVAEERLRGLLGTARAKRSAFALGRLVEREQARRVEARLELAAAKAEVERRGRQAWA